LIALNAIGVSNRDDVSCVGVLSVGLESDMAANAESADHSSSGNFLPRFPALRRMPFAATIDRKNLCGALGCNTSVRVVGGVSQTEDEDSPTALRHSEELRVQNPVRHAVPELCHFTEESSEVKSVSTGEEAGNIFEEDGFRLVDLDEIEEGKGED
jgi:hypothetical protein